MSKISASDVKKLRELTGSSILECQRALQKAEGNIEKAREHLRNTGRDIAGKKSQRKTSEGVVAAYVHSNGKIGALLELLCETDFVARNAEFRELAHDLAMHVAAISPMYLTLSDVPELERTKYEEAVREELANQKKPKQIIDKIVEGKSEKHFSELTMLEQDFIKNPDLKISELLQEKIAKIGENIRIGSFSRLEI